MGRISPLEAIENGRMTVEGEPGAAKRCGELFDVAADGQPVPG